MSANPYGQVNDTGWCACSKASGGCGRIFAGLAGFDAHHKRTGDFSCLDEQGLAGAGFYRDSRGWWHLAGRESEE